MFLQFLLQNFLKVCFIYGRRVFVVTWSEDLWRRETDCCYAVLVYLYHFHHSLFSSHSPQAVIPFFIAFLTLFITLTFSAHLLLQFPGVILPPTLSIPKLLVVATAIIPEFNNPNQNPWYYYQFAHIRNLSRPVLARRSREKIRFDLSFVFYYR